MSSDDENDDLFGDSSDSDDTAELFAATTKKSTAKKAKPAAAKKKTAAVPKKKKPAAESDDDDSSKGLFDSDSDDDDDQPKKPAKKTLSKREKLEALAKRKHQQTSPVPKKRKEKKTDGNADASDSEDSYDSATFQRTADDDNFIDTTGEDQDAVNELYAEQHFDDERPDKKKKKRKHDGGDGEEGQAHPDDDNPIMQAVNRMKKKKAAKKGFAELEQEALELLAHMKQAADQDETAFREKRPSTAKLVLLPTVVDTLTRQDLSRLLLDHDLLSVCRRWIQPLPNHKLGNVTVRSKLLETLSKLQSAGGDGGSSGITSADLKRSEFGKTIMTLYKHPDETPALKRTHQQLIELWSRPIFQKSGTLRDLDRVQRGGQHGLSAYARQQQQQLSAAAAAAHQKSSRLASGAAASDDLNDLIARGKKAGGPDAAVLKNQRVRVPFSKGFHFTARPSDKTGSVQDARLNNGAMPPPSALRDARGALTKRMQDKSRFKAKNQRSANISIEGRPAK